MPKISEDTHCIWFPDEECRVQIPEDDLKELMEADDIREISQVPQVDSTICVNCLLAQILEQFKEMNK